MTADTTNPGARRSDEELRATEAAIAQAEASNAGTKLAELHARRDEYPVAMPPPPLEVATVPRYF